MTRESFGRYTIVEELGRGGMAIVYKAHDPRFGREVALKVLPHEFMFETTFRERFEREARAIAALEHSAIVPVHDFGDVDGQPYFVMRYMAGGSLAEKIVQGPLSLDDTAAILERVGAALDWAHQHGVIHRDVKPQNILFDGAGDAYLSDFGIVKLTEATAQLTGSGFVGTPAYIAPEIGQSGGVTHLVDVYALGITLFEMLTGRRPYLADTPMGLLMAHLSQPIPDIHLHRPDLPVAVQQIVAHALAKDPAERIQRAGDITVELRQAMAGTFTAGEIIPVKPDYQSVSTAQPDAATIDVPITSVERRDVPPVETAPVPPKRRISPVVWVGGFATIAILFIGVLFLPRILTRILNREPSQPEPALEEPAPTEEPTYDPLSLCRDAGLPESACEGVSNNDEWTPYIEAKNGIEMALVPAGCFQMGAENGSPDESPVHQVCFEEPFWIDVYEVTNGQYGSSGYWTDNDLPREEVNWLDAARYCLYREARLPTEAEWEYAARGPDNLIYPWGNDFNADNLVYGNNSSHRTWQAGSRAEGVSWVGVYNLGGNVLEWINDWYDPNYYETLANGAVNPQGPTSGSSRVLRGSGWYDYFPGSAQAANRSMFDPEIEFNGIGFRCALTH
ncbi:MAG: SUMF1/EgtB/PvdO family nonheme iron enzyme [Anaerolineae bacterium]|nr:SUMF1/EgtB/PvdO family nonheme iron enzyme [Anaerolineae bacterium]